MIEPVAAQHLFMFFLTAAWVVLAAFSYALLYALGRAYPLTGWRHGAQLAYGILVLAVLALARLGNLTGGWWVLAGLLLLGYGLAPVLIWRLTVATHQGERRRK